MMTTPREPDAIFDELARTVIHAALEVHRALGPGFHESVYEEALTRKLSLRAIRFRRQPVVSLSYKGARIGEVRLDLLIDDRLVVELKSVEVVLPVHVSQVLSYLRATRLPLGLLINFNAPLLRQGVRRVVHTRSDPDPSSSGGAPGAPGALAL